MTRPKSKTVRMLISLDAKYREVLDLQRRNTGASLKWQIERAIELYAKHNLLPLDVVKR